MAAQEREQGGVEYAIVRDEDGAYLFDPEGDGTDPSWEADVDNGSWWGTEAEALANANTNGLPVVLRRRPRRRCHRALTGRI